MATRVEADESVKLLQLLKRRQVPHPRMQRILDREAGDGASPVQRLTELGSATVNLVSTVNPSLILGWKVREAPRVQ